jgi:group I intron endonuclease
MYRTTNLINGKYYIGVHSTSNLKDGYLGSGKRLRYSIKKYGKHNFKLEILQYCDSYDELLNKESEVVSLQEIAKKECMNIRVGGKGGFTKREASKGAIASNKLRIGKPLKEETKLKISQALRGKEFLINRKTFLGKHHTTATKEKISLANKGRVPWNAKLER